MAHPTPYGDDDEDGQRIVTATLRGFSAVTGISPRQTRNLIKRKILRSVLVGAKRLVIMSSYYEYLARLEAEQTAGGGTAKAANCPPPPARRGERRDVAVHGSALARPAQAADVARGKPPLRRKGSPIEAKLQPTDARRRRKSGTTVQHNQV